MRERAHAASGPLAAAGALAGAGVALFLFGILRIADDAYPPVPSWAVVAFFGPMFPAMGAFLGAWCEHPQPRGWPFVRGGAAFGAYIGWTPAVFGTYEFVAWYGPYASPEDALLALGLPFALTAGLAFALAFLQHRRVIRESWIPPATRDRRFFWDVVAYHVFSALSAAILVPQAGAAAGRMALFLLLFLPALFFLFGLGSLRMFWAAVSLEVPRIRRDLWFAAGLQALSMVAIAMYSVAILGMLIALLAGGQFLAVDQDLLTDFTLFLAPALGLGTVAFYGYVLVEGFRGTAGAAAYAAPAA